MKSRGQMQHNSYLQGTSLAKLMRVYGSTIRRNPAAWLAGLTFPADELRDFPSVAAALDVDVMPAPPQRIAV